MITLALLLFIGIQIPLSDYRLLVPFLLFKGTYFYTVGCLSYSLFPSILFSSFLISFIPSLRKKSNTIFCAVSLENVQTDLAMTTAMCNIYTLFQV